LSLPNRVVWFAAAGISLLALVSSVHAHPHIMIDAEVDIGFDTSGRVASLHHTWTFDAAFSVWMVQGLDTDGDGSVSSAEMQELADENMLGLADYGFYTVAGDGMTFSAAGDQEMRYEDGRVVLDYTIDALEPAFPGTRFELGVYDPEYYVAISFDDITDVQLEGAPQDCRARLEPPVPMAPEVEERLYALGPEVLELPPDLAAAMRGTQGLISIGCGLMTAPETALEAVNDVAQTRSPAPFGGPPPEVGLNLPRAGFFGWLQQQQQVFYASLTNALANLRNDWTAFWVLGGLSFLYGVFHAAGPGHGKVVISSYMVANERQLRQGVALSAASALLQSLVAIGFVLVLAGILNFTSTALGVAAHWVGAVSYGLVALLGLWLVMRKVLGWGHDHPVSARARDHAGHHHHHLQDDNHVHTHPHDHQHLETGEHLHHAVGPGDLRANWREQLGVVLAVGLRPCSGALVVMVFALSQGLLAAGVVAVLLMGLGTAITVAVLASLAVMAKELAGRIGGANSSLGVLILWWAELVGAIAVFAFGILLLIASL
jgi:nickel/cobalt exporter